MSHSEENVIARERSDRSNLFSQHNEIASPPPAARNDKCDIVELGTRHCESVHGYPIGAIALQHSLSQRSFRQRLRSLQHTDKIAVEISQELVHVEDVIGINL